MNAMSYVGIFPLWGLDMPVSGYLGFCILGVAAPPEPVTSYSICANFPDIDSIMIVTMYTY
jgi:hypothetical protein